MAAYGTAAALAGQLDFRDDQRTLHVSLEDERQADLLLTPPYTVSHSDSIRAERGIVQSAHCCRTRNRKCSAGLIIDQAPPKTGEANRADHRCSGLRASAARRTRFQGHRSSCAKGLRLRSPRRRRAGSDVETHRSGIDRNARAARKLNLPRRGPLIGSTFASAGCTFLRHPSVRGQDFRRTSGPIPKFASARVTFRCELRNLRTTSNFMILVRFLNLKFLNELAPSNDRNFKFTAPVSKRIPCARRHGRSCRS